MEQWTSRYVLYEMIFEFLKDNPNFLYTDIFKFCMGKEWIVIPYTNDCKELIKISEDGYTFYENGRFSIFYNKDMPETRQKFTIAHEIGHIIMYHHIYVTSKTLMMGGDCKRIWEYQADTFAQNILFPVSLAQHLKNRPNYEIANFLGVSKEMVNVRYSKLAEDLLWFRKINTK